MNTDLLFAEIFGSILISFLVGWGICYAVASIRKKSITEKRYFWYCFLVYFIMDFILVFLLGFLGYAMIGRFYYTGSTISCIGIFLWTFVGKRLSKHKLIEKGILIGPAGYSREMLKEEISKTEDMELKRKLILCEISSHDDYSFITDYNWLNHLKEQTQCINLSDGSSIYDVLLEMVEDEKGYTYARRIIEKYDISKGNLTDHRNKDYFTALVDESWSKYRGKALNTSAYKSDKCEARSINESNNEELERKSQKNLNTTEYIFCRKCGSKMPKDSKFCASCGEKFISITDKCPYCGSKILDGAMFCNKCGKGVR